MNNNHKSRNQKGLNLKNKAAHQHDHEEWTRRSFLNTLGIAGAASFMFGNIPINTMGASPLQAALSNITNDRVLVLIRLKGGNDGLNTIVPLADYGTYSQYRPLLKIPQGNVLSLNGEVGIPDFMGNLMDLWDNGQMRVLQQVGYPEQNLSHFTSSDIWASGDDAEDYPFETGWLGRFFDNEYPDFLLNPPPQPPAVQIGSRSNLLFTSAQTQMGISVANPNELYEIAQTGSLYDVNAVPDCYYGEQLAFARSISNTTFIYADVIKNAYDASVNVSDYGSAELANSRFGEQLSIVARLIKGNLGTKVYMVELDGFDTHSQQGDFHQELLTALSEGVKLFFEDLAADGKETDVLAMTISEFGRRIAENGSIGTDHGAAAPMMLFSGAMDANGIVGSNPDFNDLDAVGNLNFETDFRSVYATVLENWLCVDPTLVDAIMDNSFARVNNLVPDCLAVDVPVYTETTQLLHSARYASATEIAVYYALPTAGNVNIDIFNMNGQKLFNLYQGSQTAGSYQKSFNSKTLNLPLGNYVYKIDFKGRAFSGKLSVFGN